MDLQRLKIDRGERARPARRRRGAKWIVFLAVAAALVWFLRVSTAG